MAAMKRWAIRLGVGVASTSSGDGLKVCCASRESPNCLISANFKTKQILEDMDVFKVQVQKNKHLELFIENLYAQ